MRRFDPWATLPDYLHHILFPSFGVNCVLDVGAHRGEFAQTLRDVGYDGAIASFEPVPVSYQALEERAARDDQWRTFAYALGATDDTGRINVMEGTTYSSFRSPRSEGVEDYVAWGNVVQGTAEIEVRRLETVFEEVTAGIAEPVVFLKMDTQGWDLEVFRGARSCLERIPLLQSEMSVRPIYDRMPDFREALTAYEEHGYAISALYPVGRDQQFRLAEFDCVLVRTG
ncbi:MAG: FkbM family methyltransferase [Ilumatobacteraceae bacterium]